MKSIEENVKNMLRGKCKEYVDKLCLENPELIKVRGYYYDYGSIEQHWWVKDKEGNIIDPTKLQFLSEGNGVYEEFDGTVECSECSKEMKEEDAIISGKYAFCSTKCNLRFVGL